MTNIEIAQLISERIGQSPIPHNDIKNISYEIYQELGGESELEDFDDIYELLLTILPLAREGGPGLIDDTSIRIDKTWSSNKINSELSNYYTKTETNTLLGGKQDTLIAGQNIVITNNTISAVIDAGFHVEVVQTLPTTGEVNTIYFVPKQGGTNPDVYDEYMYINSTWEKIGSTEVDLSNYYNKTEVDTLLSGKQSTLTAGSNISITNNTIAAEGYIYNASNGAFAEGVTTQAQNLGEHAEGNYNLSHNASDTYGNAGNTQHSVGISQSSSDRKNAFEIMQNGDVYVIGVGGYLGTDTKVQDQTIKTLQEYIASLEARISALEPPVPVPNDEIWYISSNGQIVTPYQASSLPTIVSNTYVSGKGIIKFATDVTSIGEYAFWYCSDLTSVTIPNSVTSIGKDTFYHCTNLTSLTIPNSVTSIGSSAFSQCTSLTSMTIPNSVTSIGYSAFLGCTNLASVSLPNNITGIGDYTFAGCTSLTSISYTGTIAQWNAITKGTSWHTNVPATVVHCSDGDVAI